MKFVDILARELKVWPEGDSPLVQGSFGQVYICGGGPIIIETCRADDWELGEVTRAEWQAAVDALNAPKVVEWDGTGLPPAGSTCQIRHSGWAAGSWEMVDIKYISSEYLIIGHGNFKREQHFHMPDIQFRPILTAEQVAAEERENGIQEICATLGWLNIRSDGSAQEAAILYDAGYRKQVAK